MPTGAGADVDAHHGAGDEAGEAAAEAAETAGEVAGSKEAPEDGEEEGSSPVSAVEGKGGAAEAAGGAHHGADGGQRAAAFEVVQALGLGSTIGLLHLICREDAAARADGIGAASGASQAWVPLTVHIGLPLCDVPTCEAVCAQVRRRRLFSPSSLAAHTAAIDALRVRVEAFVNEHSGEGAISGADSGDEATSAAYASQAARDLSVADTAESIAYPSAPLLFDGRSMHKLSSVGELYS